MKSFYHATNGIISAFISERNLRIHFVLLFLSIGCALICNCSVTEWCLIILCSGMVISLEMVNTSLEKLSDEVEPNFRLPIKYIKDIAAGAVFMTSIASFIIGILIFIPKLYLLLFS